jgi:hypothetical protein
MPNQNQNLQNMERDAAQQPGYSHSDQSLHQQEIAKGFKGGEKGQVQKQGQGQKSGGRKDNK